MIFHDLSKYVLMKQIECYFAIRVHPVHDRYPYLRSGMIKNPTFSVLEITISILTIPSTIQQLADFCINDGRKMLCSHIFLIKKCMILQSSNHFPTDQKNISSSKKRRMIQSSCCLNRLTIILVDRYRYPPNTQSKDGLIHQKLVNSPPNNQPKDGLIHQISQVVQSPSSQAINEDPLAFLKTALASYWSSLWASGPSRCFHQGVATMIIIYLWTYYQSYYHSHRYYQL